MFSCFDHNAPQFAVSFESFGMGASATLQSKHNNGKQLPKIRKGRKENIYRVGKQKKMGKIEHEKGKARKGSERAKITSNC